MIRAKRLRSGIFRIYGSWGSLHQNPWRVPIDLTQATFKTRIIECCEAVSPDWITIDNLGVLIGADYNNSKVIHSVVEFVWELISRFGCAVTVAAHPRKQSNDVMESITLAKNPQRFFEECMGSSHFINSTGAMWGVERNEEDRTHLVLGSQRITGDHTITVTEKDDFGWLQLAQDDQVAWASLLNTNKRKESWKAMPAVFTFTTAFSAQTGLTKKPFSSWWGELKRVGLIAPVLSLFKREKIYWLKVRTDEKLLRLSLGTRDKTAANALKTRIEIARAEGLDSYKGAELRSVLPASTFLSLAAVFGWRECSASWEQLKKLFEEDMARREQFALAKIAASGLAGLFEPT